MNTVLKKELWDWAKTLAVALAAALILRQFVFYTPKVPTESMVPTIAVGERILVEKPSLHFSPIKRGEIVVFPYPDDPSQLYVKRVIGLGGETVEIRNGKVLINGQPLEEPYLNVVTEGRWGPYHVPEGHLFLLGDNRNRSRDSRLWETTAYVAVSEIKGRARAVIFPFTRLRGLR